MASPKQQTYGIHIFRRDYRLTDNTSLIKLAGLVDYIIPIFIFTPTQIRHNTYKSNNCIQFLVESLVDLNAQIKKVTGGRARLHIYYGDDLKIIKGLLDAGAGKITTISFNQDYTHYSQTRDSSIQQLTDSAGVLLIQEHDILLHPPGTILTTGGKVYTKYTPFLNASLAKDIQPVDTTRVTNFITPGLLDKMLDNGHSTAPVEYNRDLSLMHDGVFNKYLPAKGGRTAGLKILKSIISQHKWRDYNTSRDLLTYQTTHLSPYNKFGCISIREVYWAIKAGLGSGNGLISQLIWRDFFYNLSHVHRDIYTHGSMNPKWRKIRWENNAGKWSAWKTGRTGFPIVDACIRELNTTGYMHNRGRLITSNFLSRLLHVDWRWGEKYFAQLLYDYDPAQNSFGWQVSSAVSGTESRPINQTIYNPWIQSAKYDPDGTYIKRWIPELADVKPADLHRWNLKHKDYTGLDYPAPIIDHDTEKARNLALYNAVS